MKLETTKKIAMATLAAATLATSSASALDMMPHGRAEVMVGDNQSTLDLKASQNLTEKINLFGRAKVTRDYETHTTSPFAFIDVNYSLGKGFSAFYETQFIDLKDSTLMTPRFGISYFTPITKDLTFFSATSLNVTQDKDPKQNVETVNNLRYTPQIGNSKYYALAQVETVSNFGSDGLNFATQNFRFGAGKGKLEAGLSLNLKETQKTFNSTIGGFVAYKF